MKNNPSEQLSLHTSLQNELDEVHCKVYIDDERRMLIAKWFGYNTVNDVLRGFGVVNNI